MSEKSTNVLEQYDFQVLRIGRGRGAILCETNSGLMLLKEYHGSLSRLAIEDAILNHIKANGGTADSYVKNKCGNVLSIDTDGTPYTVKNWFDGRECDVRNSGEILAATRGLAQLHRILSTFSTVSSEPFPGTKADPLTFEFAKHQRELKRARSYIRSKHQKSEFELHALNSFEVFFEQGNHAISALSKSAYSDLFKKAYEKCTICHGNYTQHNVLFSQKKLVITNFDKFCINLQIMDLYLFMRKIMEKHNWDCRLGFSMLAEYQQEYTLSKAELEILYILFLYPEKFWKIINHYINSNKAWIPQKDIEKISAVIRQNQNKLYFLQLLKAHM